MSKRERGDAGQQQQKSQQPESHTASPDNQWVAGTIKRWFLHKGYGFVTGDATGEDCLCHQRVLGTIAPTIGLAVEYIPVNNPSRPDKQRVQALRLPAARTTTGTDTSTANYDALEPSLLAEWRVWYKRWEEDPEYVEVISAIDPDGDDLEDVGLDYHTRRRGVIPPNIRALIEREEYEAAGAPEIWTNIYGRSGTGHWFSDEWADSDAPRQWPQGPLTRPPSAPTIPKAGDTLPSWLTVSAQLARSEPAAATDTAGGIPGATGNSLSNVHPLVFSKRRQHRTAHQMERARQQQETDRWIQEQQRQAHIANSRREAAGEGAGNSEHESDDLQEGGGEEWGFGGDDAEDWQDDWGEQGGWDEDA